MSARLAVGAVAAALVLASPTGGSWRLGVAVLLGAAALAALGWLLAGALGRVALGRSALAIAVGAAAVSLRLLAAPLDVPPTDVPLPAGSGPWPAVVVSVGPLRDGDRPAVVELGAEAAATRLRLAATFPAWPAVVPGDRVAIDGELEPPPDGSYGEYLRRIGAAGVVRARAVELLDAPGDVGRSLEGLRRGADEALRRAIPEPEAGLASGILIGLRDRVDRQLAAAFTAVGASHVVAISGWNIAIVATTIGALAGRFARRRRAALLATAIVGYVVFVGASPSVVRAAAMAGVVLAARELGRPSRAAAAIGWAVTLLLLVDPRLVDDVGFRLSALATAGLIAWGTPLTARLAGSAPGRPRAFLAESLGVSLAAQLATLPIVALEFGRLSIVSPAVNLGVVPLVAPAMAAGALGLVAGALAMAGAPAAVATIGGLPGWALLSAIVALVRAGAAIPFASLELAAPWDAAVALAAGGAILLVDRRLRARPRAPDPRPPEADPVAPSPQPAARVAPRPRPGRIPQPRTRLERSLAAGLAVAVGALAIAVIHRPEGIARLTILDVGQGDAILLEGSRGHRLLVDGGPDPGRLLVALDEHLPPWDRRVDVVVLSHPHEDHAAGLASLLDRYGVETVLEPGMIGPGPGYAALNAALATEDIERGILMTGDRLAVDDVALQVLWPDPGSVPERPSDGGTGINNVSIVLLGEVAGHRFLLSGDIEEEIDPILLGRRLPQVEILKVAHHGSRTSSTAPFLAAVRPALAIISSGRGNPYGHPATATVERIEAGGARVLRTDTNGTVEIALGPGPFRVRADRDVAALPAAAPLPAATRPLGAAFLCGLPVRAPTSVDSPAAGSASGGAASAGAASAFAATSPAAAPRLPLPAAARTLGYHRDRDFPAPGTPRCPTIAPDPPLEPRRLARRRAPGWTRGS